MWLIWVMVISVGFYGVKGGVWTLATGGGGRVWGPPGGNLAGNNELAVGLGDPLALDVLPARGRHQPLGCDGGLVMVAMVAVAFGILGSQSRGALAGGACHGRGAWGQGQAHGAHHARSGGCGCGGNWPSCPTPGPQRMDTIQTYEADTSAMSRVWTWKTLWNVAVDRPMVGAGSVPTTLAGLSSATRPTGTVSRSSSGKVFVAHSIYFQALGEHGFVGPGHLPDAGPVDLVWRRRLARSRSQMTPSSAAWVPLLMRMTQVSLVGFAVGGAFLSLMLLDLTYYIPGIVVLTHATVHERLRQRRTQFMPRPGPGGPPS
jgi:putative inorganic carbon (HCO3(-)) transporter